MNSKALSKLTLLITAIGLTGCDGEKVDITDYLIPTQFNGNVRMVFGSEIFLPLAENDAIQIREYSKGKFEYSKYSIAKDEFVKEYMLKSKMIPKGEGQNLYSIDNELIHDSVIVNNKEAKYTFPRVITLDKEYNGGEVGTFDMLPNKNTKLANLYVTFKKAELNSKDCLIAKKTTEWLDHKNDDNSYDFDEYVYCKPYGLVVHNLSGGPKKDVVKGTVTKVLDVRKAEEL